MGFENGINIINVLKECWDKTWIYILIFISYIMWNIPFVSSYNLYSKKSWLIVSSIFAIHVLITVLIWVMRRFPKFKKDEYGIVFSFVAENEKCLSLVKEKFVGEFKNKSVASGLSFRIRLLDRFHAQKFDKIRVCKEKRDSTLTKANTKIVIYGRIKEGNEKEELSCKLHIDGIIVQAPESDENKKILSIEYEKVFVQLQDIEIFKVTETTDFEKHAKRMNLAVDYIIGIVHVINNCNNDAEELYSNLRNNPLLFVKNDSWANSLKWSIDNILYQTRILIARENLHEYYQNKDKTKLSEVKKYLERAGSLHKDEHYYNTSAIFEFEANRNVKQALIYVGKEQELNRGDAWKFSRVFLKLYEKATLSAFINSCRVYKKYFTTKNNIPVWFVNSIFDSIYRVLDKEPEKKQMHFLMYMLYHYYYTDDVLKRKHYDEFVNAYPEMLEEESLKNILIKYGLLLDEKVDIVEEIMVG